MRGEEGEEVSFFVCNTVCKFSNFLILLVSLGLFPAFTN